MAIPRVFVSSTCYDLKYIRENIKYFIRTIGYEPILSEEGDVFYNPLIHTHDSCIEEVKNCQIFVLIIGGRYGGKYNQTEISITNMEYNKAVEIGLPIFALVEQSVYSEHHLYTINCKKNESICQKIEYPSVDNIAIFKFLDKVRKNSVNNAIFAFKDFSDIEAYLKKQWAGMMYSFLSNNKQVKTVTGLFESISDATKRIELFTKEIAKHAGNETTQANIEIYDAIFKCDVIRTMTLWKIVPTPERILKNETFDEFCNNELQIFDEDNEEMLNTIIEGGPPYQIGASRCYENRKQYDELRSKILSILENRKIDKDEYIKTNI